MYTKLMSDMKEAMRAKDQKKLTVIRSIISDVKWLAKESKREVTDIQDNEISAIVMKKMKEVEDTIAEAKKGNRQDIIVEAESELETLKDYKLPALTESEVTVIINEVISGANDKAKNFKYVMEEAKSRTVGRAEAKVVSQLVQKALKK